MSDGDCCREDRITEKCSISKELVADGAFWVQLRTPEQAAHMERRLDQTEIMSGICLLRCMTININDTESDSVKENAEVLDELLSQADISRMAGKRNDPWHQKRRQKKAAERSASISSLQGNFLDEEESQ